MTAALFNAAAAKRRLYLRGMTGEQLARTVGVSEAAVSYYLNGKRRPSPGVFLRICSALDSAPEDLAVPEPDGSEPAA